MGKKSLRSTIEFQINGIMENKNYTAKLLRLIESMLMDYSIEDLSFTINIPLNLKYGLGCVSALCTALLTSTSKIYGISINESNIIKYSKEIEEKLLGYSSPISPHISAYGWYSGL